MIEIFFTIFIVDDFVGYVEGLLAANVLLAAEVWD